MRYKSRYKLEREKKGRNKVEYESISWVERYKLGYKLKESKLRYNLESENKLKNSQDVKKYNLENKSRDNWIYE